MGFGFTIGDTPYGQCIKKVLDRSRCKGLLEGDLLVEINGTVVQNGNHMAVVEILKDCPVGSTAKILVQRGGQSKRICLVILMYCYVHKFECCITLAAQRVHTVASD